MAKPEEKTTGRPIDSWDVFISHASEDKDDFVAPLANALSAFGVRVWYDDFSLSIGDSLSRGIDAGLAKSDFGLVVLSPAFISKRWPEYEIRGLVAKEMAGKKTILPIWHNITQTEILNFSPPLADKLAINSSKKSYLQIAVKIIELIRPDIFTKILRRINHYKARENGRTENIPLSKIRMSPVRHQELSSELTSRIRLIRASLLEIDAHSMEYWLDGFRRDSHPSQEVAHWEHVAAVYREFVTEFPELSPQQRKHVYDLIQTFWLGIDKDKLQKAVYAIDIKYIELLVELYASKKPIFDKVEAFRNDDDSVSEDYLEKIKKQDKEYFPDLPEDLIRKLMGTI